LSGFPPTMLLSFAPKPAQLTQAKAVSISNNFLIPDMHCPPARHRATNDLIVGNTLNFGHIPNESILLSHTFGAHNKIIFASRKLHFLTKLDSHLPFQLGTI